MILFSSFNHIYILLLFIYLGLASGFVFYLFSFVIDKITNVFSNGFKNKDDREIKSENNNNEKENKKELSINKKEPLNESSTNKEDSNMSRKEDEFSLKTEKINKKNKLLNFFKKSKKESENNFKKAKKRNKVLSLLIIKDSISAKTGQRSLKKKEKNNKNALKEPKESRNKKTLKIFLNKSIKIFNKFKNIFLRIFKDTFKVAVLVLVVFVSSLINLHLNLGFIKISFVIIWLVSFFVARSVLKILANYFLSFYNYIRNKKIKKVIK